MIETTDSVPLRANPESGDLELPMSYIRLLAQSDDHNAEDHAEEAHGDAAHAPGESAETHDEHSPQAEAHGEGHEKGPNEKYTVPEELPNFYTLYAASRPKDEHGGGHHAPWFINPLFSFFYAALFVIVVSRIVRKLSLTHPGRAQMAVEALFGGLADFFGEIVGPQNIRKFIPFIGSMWIFIVLNNWFALVPLFKSPTAHFQTTAGLAFCTFIFVNYHGFREGGIKHYFWHLCGSPTNIVGYLLSPLMLLLETIGTFVKPLSLALRLYGNIFGEDKLLAIFLGLGMLISSGILGTPTPIIGIPLHLPFLFLSLMLGGIQATVFAMLSAVYVTLLLPHEHEGEGAGAH